MKCVCFCVKEGLWTHRFAYSSTKVWRQLSYACNSTRHFPESCRLWDVHIYFFDGEFRQVFLQSITGDLEAHCINLRYSKMYGFGHRSGLKLPHAAMRSGIDGLHEHSCNTVWYMKCSATMFLIRARRGLSLPQSDYLNHTGLRARHICKWIKKWGHPHEMVSGEITSSSWYHCCLWHVCLGTKTGDASAIYQIRRHKTFA